MNSTALSLLLESKNIFITFNTKELKVAVTPWII